MDDGLFNLGVRRELLIHMVDRETGGAIDAAGVVVHGNSLRPLPTQTIHESARPASIVAGGSAGHQEQFRTTEITAIDGKIAVKARIFLGPHISTAAPALVPYAPVTNAKRLGRAVGRAFVRKRAPGWVVTILDPVSQFARGAAAHVAREVRLSIQQAA